ncbi:MAG: hypothetical protein AB7U34_02675 [Novosphingobium sp.]
MSQPPDHAIINSMISLQSIFRAASLATATLALVACTTARQAPPPRPATTATPTPAAPPAPAPAPVQRDESWMDASRTPGDWTYGPNGAETRALYAAPDGTSLFAIVCTADKALWLVRPASAEAQALMKVRTETTERLLAVETHGGSLMARLSPRDPLLDAMAISKGRFAIETPGMATLYLPSWAEVTRVIEDCR